MTSSECNVQDTTRFVELLGWLPDKTWLYVISVVFVFIIWLFFPLLFVFGLILLILWFTA